MGSPSGSVSHVVTEEDDVVWGDKCERGVFLGSGAEQHCVYARACVFSDLQ